MSDEQELRAPGRGFDAATIMLGVPLVASIGVALIRGSRHFSWDWPTHAHHHLLANIATAVGLAVVSLLILWGPLRTGARWAWWAMVVAGMAIFGGFWLGNLTVGFGEPATQANIAQAVFSIVYVAGLAAAWREIAGDRAESSSHSAERRTQVWSADSPGQLSRK